MPSNLHYAIIMLFAGIGIPVLAALNARLGARIGSPAHAALVLFCIALAVTALVLLITRATLDAPLFGQPKHLYLGGTLVAFYVLSVTFIAPHFGVGNAIFFVLLGQLISAGLIDHFGLFGAIPSPITATRAAGIAAMSLGVYLTQKV